MVQICARAVAALQNEAGQDLMEYVLLGAVISVGCVAAMGTIASNLVAIFADVAASL